MNKILFNKLMGLLDVAYKTTLEFKGGYSDHFYDVKDFRSELERILNYGKKNNRIDIKDLGNLKIWFMPSYDWDDLIGNNELGNEILSILLKIDNRNSISEEK